MPSRDPPSTAHCACHCCGQIHRVRPLAAGEVAECVRCGSALSNGSLQSKSRSAAAALGAFFLYWPAVLLPILRIEKLGHRSESSLMAGTLDILRHGDYFVGIVVLLFSLVFPLLKLVVLLELNLLGILQSRQRAITFRLIEVLGKWSMMDVLLLAFLVMLVKLGNLVTFQVGPAVYAFVGCVAMSMIASLTFDPHAIWEHEA